jgi:nicotinamidase-related amidase
MMKRALIMIDMQQGSFTEASPRYDTENLIRRLNDVAERIRSAGNLVIFIQHEGPESDEHYPGAPGWHLLSDLKLQKGDLIVRKKSCDAFLNTDLETVLNENSIGQLVITGCATDYCVDTTVRSALARGYSTIVPADGHTTADRPHLSAEKIIEHHNAIWTDFIAPAGPAIISRCDMIG